MLSRPSFPALLLLALLLSRSAVAEGDYPPMVKSIVENRCMVCHGCYDAPCQLKLEAWDGLQRGASDQTVYDGTRLKAVPPTRLFDDAQTVQEWGAMGFFPVLDARDGELGLIARMLALKRQHPLPSGDRLPDSFTLGLDRKQVCARQEDFDAFAREHPSWGMPYGLPGLTDSEHETLVHWLEQGAPGVAVAPATAAEIEAIRAWESFLNGDSLKQRLVARYIHEHLFLADLHFPDAGPDAGFYSLVRSRTPPGQPIDVIATRRPYDDPGVDRVYYRLRPVRTTILDKRHMPYALDAERMRRWQSWFLDPDYEVTALPPYTVEVATNPFITFRELPQQARYRFMLDEARFTIMGFIKGPVCRGQVALNVIEDHFWVAFLDPDAAQAQESAAFLASQGEHLRLPADRQSGALVSLLEWRQYSKAQLAFLWAKYEFIRGATGPDGVRVDLDLIWDGDGHNENAALTVFRHEDSASVVKGFVGQQPKTAWVIDYALLERLHYLLVAGFDVFGNVAHQLESRLYMDFLRMEGEQNFLFFLPPERRILLRDFWYRDAEAEARRFVLTDAMAFDRATDIQYATDDPKRELLNLLQERLPGASATRYQPVDSRFDRLRTLQGAPFSLMPEVSFLRVRNDRAGDSFYSILLTRGYSNNAQIFREQQRRIPQEDYLTVVNGFIGSYPNMFFDVPDSQLGEFIARIESMRGEADYAALLSAYGVRRTQAAFWPMADALTTHYRENFPVEAGLFDLNRYENR